MHILQNAQNGECKPKKLCRIYGAKTLANHRERSSRLEFRRDAARPSSDLDGAAH